MGISLSTPNYVPREDQLAFPPEILEKIETFLTPSDLLVSREVCTGWMNQIVENGTLANSIGICVEKSEYILQELAKSSLPLMFSSFFLKNLELTRPTLNFWTLYSETITYLEFTDCAILPRNPSGLTTGNEFSLGCPNLRHLGLINMDKYFMMGGQFLQLHEILCLENLESLDLTDNTYISDQIIFSILLKTKHLKSLNLSGCPILFIRVVHNRFYPKGSIRPPYSDNVLSFETLVEDFLLDSKGSQMRELKLKSTTISVNSRALQLISDPNIFHWESVDLSECREVKSSDYVNFIGSQSVSLKKLVLSTSSTQLSDQTFCQSEMKSLEHLEIQGCRNIKNLKFLQNMPNLKFLNVAHCEFEFTVDDFIHVPKLKELIMDSMIVPSNLILTEICPKVKNITELSLAECSSWITDNFIQSVIKNLRKLKRLNIQKSLITDRGIAGTELDDFEEARFPSKIVQTKREAVLNRLDTLPNGHSLSELTDLQELNLSHCQELGEGTWKLALKFLSLSKLDLSSCSQLTPKGLQAIVKNCPSLESINLLYCGNHITSQPELMGYVQKSLYRLRRLVI